jgi:hypothetical protein
VNKILKCLMISIILWMVPVCANAQSKPPKQLVEDLSKGAFDALLAIQGPDAKMLVSPDEKKNLFHPLLPYAEREKAVARGYLSGFAQWCSLPWEKDFFEPYIASLRTEHKKGWSKHQYAYIEVLHGVAMGVAVQSKKGQTCPKSEKERLTTLSKK